MSEMRWGLVTAVLAVLLGWSVPTFAGQECPKLQAQIIEACQCPAESRIVGTFHRLRRSLSEKLKFIRIPSESYTDCQTGEVVRVACIESPQTGESERVVSERKVEPSSECLGLIDQAVEKGCVDRESESFEIPCNRDLKTPDPIPLCEDIRRMEAWACDFLPYQEKYRDRLLQVYDETFDPLGNPENPHFVGDGGRGVSGEERPSLTTDPEDEEVLDSLLPNNKMRLEIPANFLRYMVSNIALPTALDQINRELATRDPTGRSKCDTRELSCVIDPLLLTPLETMNREDVDLDYGEEDAQGRHPVEKAVRTSAEREGDCVRIKLVEYQDRGMKISWQDGVLLCTERRAEIDFRDDFHLQYTSATQPSGRANYIDRFLLFHGMSDGVCELWSSWRVGRKRPNGIYLPWTQPYSCSCDNSDIAEDDDDANNYCIVDPVDRPVDNPYVTGWLRASAGEAVDVYCSEPLVVASDQPGTVALRLDEYLRWSAGMHPQRLGSVAARGRQFGCMGQTIPFVTQGLVQPLEFPTDLAERLPFGKKPSISPFSLQGSVDLPKLSAQIDEGLLLFEIPLFTTVSEKLRKRWYTWALGWVVRIVERILSGIVSFHGTLLINILNLIDNKIIVDFDSIDFTIDGMIVHDKEVSGMPAQGVGVRRIVMDPVKVTKTEAEVAYSFDRCTDVELVEGPHKLLELIVGCPIQAIWNGVRFILNPLTNYILHLDDLLEWITTPLIEKTVFEESSREFSRMTSGSKFAELISQAHKDILWSPHQYLPYPLAEREWGFYYGITTDPNDPRSREEQMAVALPQPLSQICTLVQNRASGQGTPYSGACLIAEILAGVRAKRFEAGYSLDRVGIKSHYRSQVANVREAVTALSNPEPITYYCGFDVGDFSPDRSYTERVIRALTDFSEIDRRREEADSTVGFSGGEERSNLLLDYTRQCALFFDLRFLARVTIDAELAVRAQTPLFHLEGAIEPSLDFGAFLTQRTQLLINEVFVCEDSARCNPVHPFLTQRAKRAMCSIMEDIRLTLSESGEEVFSHTLLDAAEQAPKVLGVALKALDLSEPWAGKRVPVFVTDENIRETIDWIGECRSMLSENPL